MKKLVLILAALALVVTACSPNSSPAATVDGSVITVDDVEAMMYSTESVVGKPDFAQFLGVGIQLEIFFNSAEADYGVTVTDEAAEAQGEVLYQENSVQPDGTSLSREEFLEQSGISEGLLVEIGRRQLAEAEVRTLMADEVSATEEELELARAQAELELAEVCVSHILVETDEDAADVTQRLDDGEDFAALATEVSTDPSAADNAGDLGCSPPARFVTEFADATMTVEIGEPSDPVETQFGFHIILVSDRTEADPAEIPSDEELEAGLTQFLVDDRFSTWLGDALAAAVVVVEPEYGTWTAGPPAGVTPPPA